MGVVAAERPLPHMTIYAGLEAQRARVRAAVLSGKIEVDAADSDRVDARSIEEARSRVVQQCAGRASAPHLCYHRRWQIGIVREQRECARQAGVRRQPVEIVVGLRIQRVSVDLPTLRDLIFPTQIARIARVLRNEIEELALLLVDAAAHHRGIVAQPPEREGHHAPVADERLAAQRSRAARDQTTGRHGRRYDRAIDDASGTGNGRLRQRAVGNIGAAVGVGPVGVIVDPVVVEILHRRDEVATLAPNGIP